MKVIYNIDIQGVLVYTFFELFIFIFYQAHLVICEFRGNSQLICDKTGGFNRIK